MHCFYLNFCTVITFHEWLFVTQKYGVLSDKLAVTSNMELLNYYNFDLIWHKNIFVCAVQPLLGNARSFWDKVSSKLFSKREDFRSEDCAWGQRITYRMLLLLSFPTFVVMSVKLLVALSKKWLRWQITRSESEKGVEKCLSYIRTRLMSLLLKSWRLVLHETASTYYCAYWTNLNEELSLDEIPVDTKKTTWQTWPNYQAVAKLLFTEMCSFWI